MSRNLLDRETSPYLLQHKDNPVHWRPWNAATLAEADRLRRPILLSIGYAACHWCHVMAHESFENAETAALINALFVPVKVDREERPDLDAIHQAVLPMLGQRGGWPLTMFLTPKGEPFWGGTYFPPEPRHGMPGFCDVLTGVADIWKHQPEKIAGNAEALKAGLIDQFRAVPGGPEHDLSLAFLERAADSLLNAVDPVHGGLSGAPKFPHAPLFTLLWRVGRKTGRPDLCRAVVLTLERISRGGIYDHLGGGFARYSIDEAWRVPHFEKMLYDNAQMIELLTEVTQETGDPLFARRVEETVGWALREMRTEGGAFAASLDADSEGEEGRHYVWSAHEIEEHLPKPLQTLFAAAYGVSAGGNWENGKIVLALADSASFTPDQETLLADARRRLLAVRSRRPQPGRDDKILADWNGMMIAALARAGFAFDRPDWIAAAEKAFAAVTARVEKDGRLCHSVRLGQCRGRATLDDHAQMARAALTLAETGGDGAYLAKAEDWVATADRFYRDEKDGGYFFTAADAEDLPVRVRTAFDNSTPSGNGVMVEVLARLHLLTGNESHRSRAEAVVRAFAGEIPTSFASMGSLLNGWEMLESGRSLTLSAGRPGDPAFRALLAAARRVPPTWTIKRQTGDGNPFAILCRGRSCGLPLYDGPSLSQALKGAF